MVKADIKRNYYADLEVPNDASVEDIKKAYRKLALKYHPDRNPGNESEIVPKFQAIQAAQEILSDPVSKSRYDADRRKAGLGAGAFTKPNVPPRSTGQNPMYQASSNFPPPPRRTPNPTASWRSTASGASGADRFTNFPKPAAPTSKKTSTDPANVFNAWQNMKSQTAGASPQPPPRPTPKRPVPNPPPRRDTRRPTEEDIRAGMNYREAPPRPTSNAYGGFRSAWAEYNGAGTSNPGASTASSTPRKGGFDPTSTGDEGQAGSTANYSSSRRRSADPPYYPPPPPRSASNQTNSDVPFEGIRTKSAYSGEDYRRTTSTSQVPTTSESGPSLGRSTRKAGTGTARKPFVVYSSSDDSETEDDSAFTTPDTAQKIPQPTATEQTADPSSRPFTRPKKTPNPPSRQFKNGVPYKAPDEASGSSSLGPDPASDAGEKDKPTMYANYFSTPSPKPQEKMPSPVYPFGRNYQHNKSPDSIPRWAVPSSVPPVKAVPPFKRSHSAAQRAWVDLTNTEASENTGKSQPHFPERPTYRAEPNDLIDLTADDAPTLQSPFKKACFTKDDATGLYRFCHRSQHQSGADTSSHSFTIPINADTFRPNVAKSRSEDSINTSFVAEQWAGDFTSNNVFAAAQHATGSGRKSATPSRKSSRAFRQQPRVNTFPETTPSVEPTEDATVQSPPPPPAKYRPDEWAKHFQDASWAFDPNALRTSSPGKPESKTTSRSNSTAVRKGSRVANKIPVNTSKPATVADEEEELAPRTHSPDEMDVDEAPPAGTNAAPQAPSAQEPRMYPVDTTHLHQGDNEASKRESDGFKVRLDDLGAAVDPQPSQGLDGFSDISNTLPFTSKASTTIPTFTPQSLQMPTLPRAPSTPTKLTRSSWSTYCISFSIYLDKFDKFNSTLLAHFSRRQEKAARLVRAGVKALEAVGEASTGEGFMSYAQAIKEDERVREHWNIGSEKHGDAVREFENVRERVRVLSEGAGLPEN
ncbi:hypothetical protein E4T38_04648 [Aureobasidium subglaciale]|nr:hypothetical protein E4T38_04648 [Aureobasidium subglaciale]KAI5223807.1 hypothetical protein E4T40_04424 [Aureobasidium subglaciale]KAI5227119.1 hypothetical protein E4T41_04449 [Aureobasidium subglaciale]KAI5262600.1 hypothetical protein E4T46_04335 [Aureobasidium subglaciale]